MARILTMPELIGVLDAEAPGWDNQPSSDWRTAPDSDQKVVFLMREACLVMRRHGETAALAFLRRSAAELGFYPLLLIMNVIWLARRLHREPEAVADCFEFARQAFSGGYYDLSLEACTAAVFLDTHSDYALTNSPERSRALADLYEKIAKKVFPELAGRVGTASGKREENGVRLRVGLVTSNLVDVVGYTKTALHFARYYDRSRFDLRLYVTENLAQRDVRLFPFGSADYRSEQTGAAAIAECRQIGVPVWLAPRDLTFISAVRRIMEQVAADGVDVLIFQSGLACPIDWLTMRLAPVPAKLAINIGSFLFNRGLAATFYDNPYDVARETGAADSDMGARFVLRQGTDIAELDRQPPLSRAQFGIPADALVIGVMSNHLARRMSDAYLRVIADLLQRNKNLWFVAFGSPVLPEKQAFFDAYGVGGRVVFGAKQMKAGAALKMLDVYANEFPVGGSQSVIEAMACGVPVAAMRWSDAHAECAGAAAVGENFAVGSPDPAAYAALIQSWLDCADLRAQAGAAMRARAEQEYSVARYVQHVLGYAAELLHGR